MNKALISYLESWVIPRVIVSDLFRIYSLSIYQGGMLYILPYILLASVLVWNSSIFLPFANYFFFLFLFSLDFDTCSCVELQHFPPLCQLVFLFFFSVSLFTWLWYLLSTSVLQHLKWLADDVKNANKKVMLMKLVTNRINYLQPNSNFLVKVSST